MRRNSLYVFILFSAALLTSSCATQRATSPDNRADEKALREADIAWSNAASSLDGFLSYYTDDVTVLPPNEPVANGKEAARKTIDALYKTPGISLKWQPVKVEVARSGDIGYVRGTYEMTMNDSTGKPMTDHGKYVEVWRRQPDGSWKCIVDTFNSDLPPTPSPTK